MLKLPPPSQVHEKLGRQTVADPGFAKEGRTMASEEREPIRGSGGRTPSEVQGQSLGGLFVHFHIKEGPKVKDLNDMI